MKTLTLRSDLVAAGGFSTVRDYGGYAVLKTPDEPDFWHGNQIVLPSLDVGFDAAEMLFQRHFPDAAHRVFSFDTDTPNANQLDPAFAEHGLTQDWCDTLEANDVDRQDLPVGATLGLSDWSAVFDLSLIIAVEQGFDAAGHAAFLKRRIARYRTLVEAGTGKWLTAWVGKQLVGQLGIFTDGEISRFQGVETHPDFRGKGIASALLSAATAWSRSVAPAARVVIVAETDSKAAGLYERLGFLRVERTLALERGSY